MPSLILLCYVGRVAGVVVFAVVIIPNVHATSNGIRNVVIIAFANSQLVLLVVQIALICFPEWPNLRYYVDWSYRWDLK